MLFMRVFVAMAMAASVMLVVIVASLLMIVLMLIGASLMGVATTVLMIMAVLVRLGLVLGMAVSALVTPRIFMIVFVFVAMVALAFALRFVRHKYSLSRVQGFGLGHSLKSETWNRLHLAVYVRRLPSTSDHPRAPISLSPCLP
jgi:hypothetical protein